MGATSAGGAGSERSRVRARVRARVAIGGGVLVPEGGRRVCTPHSRHPGPDSQTDSTLFWYHLHAIAGLDTKKAPQRRGGNRPISHPSLKTTHGAEARTATAVKYSTRRRGD